MKPSSSTWIGVFAVAILLLLAAVLFGRLSTSGPVTSNSPPPKSVTVERVYSGHTIKTDDGQKIHYAGIRAPYASEPLFEEAKQRNRELVGGKKIRLRFDEEPLDRQDRLTAYAFVDGEMANETLVREGLAYVRLTSGTERYSEQLLAAQIDARRHKKGLWRKRRNSGESSYPADPKYGNFHRPECKEVSMMNLGRRRDFRSVTKALDEGFAPCVKCRP